ncbi:hypothetical protein FEM48_Zijuj04G0173700 [Ziziphus jujuba var. spinosa]|uniref:GDP-D-glucose phosphorylase 1 n=1 Tax=Ziziphus jujuba var. spinosa TaxID=714518 RepID=A0A978VL65_ZIZJJ|nr:hypothetical protein FEM48_Zijuj04G0173700 [Ziziphus jujuba var. spinosa]
MLTIKRVATVVSNYQEEGSGTGLDQRALGCGRNCLAKCCLPASKLPLYTFNKDGEVTSEHKVVTQEHSHISFLHNLLLGQWEDRMNRGLFRYDVTTCETKIIPGHYGFIAQLNEGRHLKKRPTEFRIDQVLQPFNEEKFNFTKVGQEEVLFRFESSDNNSHFWPSAPVDMVSNSPSVVAINVSPIEYGHVLLIPRVLDCLSQKIDRESFLLAMHMAKEAVPYPVEKAPTQRIIAAKGLEKKGVIVSQLLNYPVRGLLFEGGNTMRDLSDAVASSCICLQNSNIPFNVLISDCGKRIFLFPQSFAEKQALGEVSNDILETQVNPAVWEISGHIVLKRRKDFNDASETYAWRLLAEVSLSEERFEVVKSYIMEAAEEKEEEAHYNPVSPKAPSHLSQDCMVLQC